MARLIEVTWTAATKSAGVDLEGLDVVGFYDADDDLTGTALTVTTAGTEDGTESDPVVDFEASTTPLTIGLDAGAHNFILIPAWRFSGVLRWLWFTSTATETGTAYLVVRDLR